MYGALPKPVLHVFVLSPRMKSPCHAV
ncbi:protein of unknown function (plasmid) [Caballeronia sp. S22]